MKACVLHAVGDLRYEEVKMPVPGSGEALVEVHACGICGSDIPRVLTKGTYHFPTIPGHEFAGVVKAVGDESDAGWVGARVAVFPLIPCRKCEACETGHYAQCSDYNYLGSRCDGGFSEYVVAPIWNLVPAPDEIPLEVAAMCEPAAVAYHAVTRGRILPGENVLVVGAGTIGLIVAMWARAAGAARVLLSDISPQNLELAHKLGFQHTILSSQEDLSSQVKTLTQEEGVSCSFDCVGIASALEDCLLNTNPFGCVVTVGNPNKDMLIHQNAYWCILRKELTLHGTWNSGYAGKDNDWKKVLKALSLKQIDLEPLITHRFPLQQHREAFQVLTQHNEFVVKVLFVNEERRGEA